MTPRTAVVTTTINIPYLLKDYLTQFSAAGRTDLDVVIVGDRKSPPQTREWLQRLDWAGHRWTYLDVDDQEKWNARVPALGSLLPWNSIQRRNLGYLHAAEQGAEVIISIDDDNHVTEDDFLAGHSIVGTTTEVTCVQTESGWANVCNLLRTDSHRVVPRGWPQRRRQLNDEWTTVRRTGRVVVNAGLWLGEPDVDAVSRLVTPVEVLGLTEDAELPLGLAKGTWCPFNSQNTAFHRDLLASMYLVVMGPRYRGVRIDRYDDIWMSYATRAIADHLGDLVTFGRPLVRQDRNPHDHLHDMWGEMPGMVLTEQLVDALRDIDFTGSTYLDCYRELIDALRSTFTADKAPAEDREFWAAILTGMTTWTDICEEVVLGG
ncbi:hypothetical protein AB0D78_45225 [Streptomyces avermitilis]|uniref:hypothetical protein n=1 Tax=Streptomyces avermitilis TaxID=33903 RepID=UPI0033AF28A3